MPASAYLILASGTILWVAPFPFVRRKQSGPITVDRRARWGIALVCLAYTLLWQGPFWTRSPGPWTMAAVWAFFAAACLISWTAARALGKQMRLDAAVDAGHELIRSGPYRLMRHPIYTSMLCLLVGTGLLLTPVYLFLPAVVLFFAGTWIRMRVEEQMLAARFGEQYEEYRRGVRRLIPFVI